MPKEGDKCNLCNYRLISVLPVFSKGFEKVAYTQMYDYLENNSILHKQRYLFLAKKSSTQAIFHFLQYLYKHIYSGNIVFLCYWIFTRHSIVLTTRFCYES